MVYRYQPLRSRNNEIRVLKLLPSADQSAAICCELEIVSLNDNPIYSALSYCWADPPDPRIIKLHGHDREVTGNLYEALVSVRDEKDATCWWIDALCINQYDVEERSLQIFRMTVIYRTAFHVVAWIGSRTPGQPNLEQYLNYTAALLQSDCDVDVRIGHFHDLLSRKYWRRMWIVQEISVATDIWIVCGSSWVNWDTLCHVISLFEEVENGRVHEAKRQHRDFPHELGTCTSGNTTPMQSITKSTEQELIHAYQGLQTFINFRDLVTKQTPISFLEALKKTSAFLATDNRDKIYALLGIVYDGRSFVPNPDYDILLDDLKAQMARNYLQSTKNLEVILACGHEQILDGTVPSWTPNWLDLGLEADYAFSKDPARKFRAAGDWAYIPTVDRWDPRYIRAECLIFQQLDGLSSVYGRTRSTNDYHEGLIQPITKSYPDPYTKQSRISIWNIREYSSTRARTIRALFDCLTEGPSLETISKTKWSYLRHGGSRLLWLYYGTKTYPCPWYKSILAIYQAKRRFDSTELRLWLEENREFLIHGKTFESLCKSQSSLGHCLPDWTAMLFLTTVLILILALPLCAIFVLLGLASNIKQFRGIGSIIGSALGACVSLVLLGVYTMCFGYYANIAQHQEKVLEKMNKYMKERQLRLAITVGSPGGGFGWGGLLALVPGSARRGDYLAILKGCSTPVVLREQGDGYQVIGMVYLKEVMGGELMRRSTESWKKCKLY